MNSQLKQFLPSKKFSAEENRDKLSAILNILIEIFDETREDPDIALTGFGVIDISDEDDDLIEVDYSNAVRMLTASFRSTHTWDLPPFDFAMYGHENPMVIFQRLVKNLEHVHNFFDQKVFDDLQALLSILNESVE